MINALPAFLPSLVPTYPSVAGLRVFIGAGTVDISGTTLFVPGAFVNVQPLAITYVYLNMANGAIASNTTGFSGNIWPIAIITTSTTEIITLSDVRPDVAGVGGGGSGISSAADTSLTLAVSGTVAIAAGTNYYCPCADGTTQTLPSAAGLTGQWITFVKRGSGASVTIAGGLGGTKYLSNQNQFIRYQTDGTAWDVSGGN